MAKFKAPNSTNPVEVDTLEDCLMMLAEILPDMSYRSFVVGVDVVHESYVIGVQDAEV